MYARGLRRRKAMFGEADVEKRMAASGEFGAPLCGDPGARKYWGPEK